MFFVFTEGNFQSSFRIEQLWKTIFLARSFYPIKHYKKVQNMVRVNNTDTRITSLTLWQYFTPTFSVSIDVLERLPGLHFSSSPKTCKRRTPEAVACETLQKKIPYNTFEYLLLVPLNCKWNRLHSIQY